MAMRKQSQMSKAIDELVDKVKRLEVQIEIARLDEREKCAKLCDDLADLNDWADSYANKCAAVIRARKTE
jgi:hypothetical protein